MMIHMLSILILMYVTLVHIVAVNLTVCMSYMYYITSHHEITVEYTVNELM